MQEWENSGYNLESLQDAMDDEGYTVTKLKALFKDYEENIERLEEQKDKLLVLDVDKNSECYLDIKECLNDPSRVEEVEEFVTTVAIEPKLKELKAELASLNITGFEDEAKRIIHMIDRKDDPLTIGAAIKSLRRHIKEAFFEKEFMGAITVEEKPKPRKIGHAETVFMLHMDGSLLAVKSRLPKSQIDKKELSRAVMIIRKEMELAREGEMREKIPFQSKNLLLHTGNDVYIGVIISGTDTPVMYKLMLKVGDLMEKKFEAQFKKWKGDRQSLGPLDRYINALFQAFDKL